jgi:hypothetical protein
MARRLSDAKLRILTRHGEVTMSKRILILSTSLVVALLALLLGGAPTVAASSVGVTIDAAAEAVENTDFTASVSIANLTSFDAGQFDVSFNESMLRLDRTRSARASTGSL